MSYIGRIFAKPYYLNLTGNKVTQGFMAPYSPIGYKRCLNREEFEKTKKHIRAGFSSNIVKNNLTPQSYKTYEKYTLELRFNYILQHTKDNEKDNMRAFLNNQTTFNYAETLFYFSTAIEKAKDVMRILSFYLITKYPAMAPYCAAIIEKDATSSGLQIISIAIRDKALATLVNVAVIYIENSL